MISVPKHLKTWSLPPATDATSSKLDRAQSAFSSNTRSSLFSLSSQPSLERQTLPNLQRYHRTLHRLEVPTRLRSLRWNCVPQSCCLRRGGYGESTLSFSPSLSLLSTDVSSAFLSSPSSPTSHPLPNSPTPLPVQWSTSRRRSRNSSERWIRRRQLRRVEKAPCWICR